MELKLQNTEYGSLVQQLGDLPAFKAAGPMFGRWFDTKEAARQKALEWYEHDLTGYKRDCEGKRQAAKNIVTLTSPQAR